MDKDQTSVTVHITYKKSDLIGHSLRTNHWPIVLAALYVFAAMLVVLIGASHFIDRDVPEYARYYAVAALLAIPLFSVYLNLSKTMRTVGLVARTIRPFTIRFSDDGIEADREHRKESIEWKAFNGVIDTKKLFIFIPRDYLILIVPKRCFADDQEMTSFRTLIERNLEKDLSN